jgi:predicted dehydrogenase
MKILIIGYGSIGRRHHKNLIKLGHKDISLYDPCIKESKLENLEQFDVVFVCSPNNLHITHALLATKAGCYIFIEKPLSHNIKDISKLEKIVKSKKLINMVACNMRFHPALQFIKKYLEQKKLGKIYSIKHYQGQYLPDWRPCTDYSKNYAAKRSTGGGIILDDIHEFDLLFWLNNFKPVSSYKIMSDKVSNLKIETEDIAHAMFKFKNKVLGIVTCDYLQQSYSRGCKIVGEKGNIEWDFTQNIVWLKTKDKSTKIFQMKSWDVNQMYIDEVKYFLSCVKKKKQTFNSIATAKSLLTYLVKK